MQKDFKKQMNTGVFIIFFIFIVMYGFFQARSIILGVKIKDLNIQNNSVFQENPVKITGNTKNAIFVSVNDREITIDKNGNFEEHIALLSGYNILEIKAEDKFGNQDIVNYKLILN